MSNKKKLKSKDGATRIVPIPGGNLYAVQAYDAAGCRWEDIEGLYDLMWEQAQTGRRNYVTARNMVRNVNKQKIHAHIGNK